MSEFVCVLECEAGRRLAKQIEADGTVSDYDGGFLFRAEHIPVENLGELGDLVEALAGDPTRCVIRGAAKDGAEGEWVRRLSRDPVNDPGAVAAFEERAHPWVCIDLDASVIALDPADPRTSIEAWRASLPAPLNACGMVFHLSAKAHLYPYLRGHAWIWCTRAVDSATLRRWYAAGDYDPALAQAVQIHYTADPVWADGVDPYAGRRVHRFDGPPADIAWGDTPAPAERGSADARTMPAVPPDADVIAVLGPAADHEGHRWFLCGALGGVWRRMCWSAARAKATIEAWLEPLEAQGCDIRAGVIRCLGAWEVPFDRASGGAELATHLGGGEAGRAWAERVARASQTFKSSAPAGDAFAPVTVAGLVGDLDQPILLSGARNVMYVRTDSGYAGPYHKDQMTVVLRALGLQDMVGRNGEGKLLRPDAIYSSGEHIETVVRAFTDPTTWYDRDAAELHHGYELPPIEPVEDPAVARWLELLCGDMLPNVHEWIGACAQPHMGLPAAALVVVGAPGIGKTVIFRALARMWGARSFVPLVDSIAQFNGSITRCPVVCDDECAALKSRKVTSAEFRQRVQATERDYELKGKERVELHGCTREGITANDLTEVAFTDVRGAGVVDALRDRLLVVECSRPVETRAALAAVRAGGDADAELDRIMGHVAWLWASGAGVTAEAGRFIGAGGAAAERVAMAGVALEGADLWDSLARFLDSDPVDEADPRAAGWVVYRGMLYGNPSALAQLLSVRAGKGWDTARVGRLLRAVSLGDYVRIRTADGYRPRFYPLDLDRVIDLVG